MSPALVALILSLLLGLQPLTTDLYLPALPALSEAFAAPAAQAQLTLTGVILAFGLSQLLWGPLSDRIGRRKVLLAGLAGYTLAAVGSLLATSIEVLVFWRIMQGACMGAGTVCSRAIVRDLYTPQEGARAMSKGLSGLGVAACVGPLLGGMLTQTLGWRATLALIALAGALTLVVVARQFRETLHQPNAAALNPLMLARSAATILAHRTFWTFALLSSSSFCGLFCFLTASSFIIIRLFEVPPYAYGLLLSLVMLFYIGGTILCRRLIMRVGVGRTVAVGAALSLGSGVLLLLCSVTGWLNVWTLMLPTGLYMIGHGIHQPCGQSGAVAPFPHIAGTASALTGALIMVCGFGAARWVGAHMDGSPDALIHGMFAASVAVAVIAWGFVVRSATPPRAAA